MLEAYCLEARKQRSGSELPRLSQLTTTLFRATRAEQQAPDTSISSEEMYHAPHNCFSCLQNNGEPQPFAMCLTLQSTGKLHLNHQLKFLFCCSGPGMAKHRGKERGVPHTWHLPAQVDRLLAGASCSNPSLGEDGGFELPFSNHQIMLHSQHQS